MTIELNSDIKSAKRTKQTRTKQVIKSHEAAVAPSAGVVDNFAPMSGPLNAEARHAMIAKTAYGYAAQRGFTPGRELDDWLTAEAEIDARLCGETHPF